MRIVETLGAMALCVLVGYVGGCTSERLGARDVRTQLTTQLDIANGNIDACTWSLADLQQRHAAEIAAADTQVAQAAQAVEQLIRDRQALDRALQSADADLAQAAQAPTCREQLEVELCPAIPLL